MKYIVIKESNEIEQLYDQIENMEEISIDKPLLQKLKQLDKKLILFKDDYFSVSYPKTILDRLAILFYERTDSSKLTKEEVLFEKRILSLHETEKFEGTDEFINANKNIEGFWEELIDYELYYFTAEKIKDNQILKKLISNIIKNDGGKKNSFFKKFYSDDDLLVSIVNGNRINRGNIRVVESLGEAYKFFRNYNLLDLIFENEPYLLSEYHITYLDFFIEEKIELARYSGTSGYEDKEKIYLSNILELRKCGFKTRFEHLSEELEANKTNIFSSLLEVYSQEAYESGIFLNLYKLIFCTMMPSNEKYLKNIFCRLNEKKIDFFNKEIIIDESFRGIKTIAENFLCGFVTKESNDVNKSFQDLEEYLGGKITFSSEGLSYLIEKTSILSIQFIKKYGSNEKLEKAFLNNFLKKKWSFLLEDIFLSNTEDRKILEIGLTLFKRGLLRDPTFINDNYETIYHDLTYYREYLAENDVRKEASYEFDLLFCKHLISLENKTLLKALRFIDYNGKTLLHNIAINQDVNFLKKLLNNIKDRKYSKLEQTFNLKDYYSKFFYEYLKDKDNIIAIKKLLGIKIDDEDKKKQRGNYEFLFSTSLFDTIFNFLNIENKEIIKHTPLMTLNNLNISKVMDEELKAIDSCGFLEKNAINLKNVMKFTDNVDDSSERALRKHLNNILGNEAYKILNVVQRLGYSIIKNNSKSEDIINIFSKLNNDRYLTKIVSVVVNILFPVVSKNIYFDSEFKTYKIKSDENCEGINFIKKEDIINTFTKLIYIDTDKIRNDGFITLNNFSDRVSDMVLNKKEEDLLNLLSEISKIFYGEDIVKLLKDLRKIIINDTKLYEYENKYRNEKIILKNLEKNMEINYDLKTVTLSYDSKISEADFVFLKSQGYTIK